MWCLFEKPSTLKKWSFQDKGCFSIVLECIPAKLAGLITKSLKIPTIGIGAGADCDGQVLVLYDILGLYSNIKPKFVKVYQDLSTSITKAVEDFNKEIKTNQFPDKDYSFSMKEEEFERVRAWIMKNM